jgi:hypothetical protein
VTQPLHDEPVASVDPGEIAPAIDLDALLVALVLVPQSYPRNRFYELYGDPAARRVRRRAALVRGIIADLGSGAVDVAVERGGQKTILRYRHEKLGTTRMSLLSEDELALVQLVVDRAPVGADSDALARVRPLLMKLFDR